MKKSINRKTVRLIGLLIFLCYLASLAYFCFFSEAMGRTDLSVGYRYNLVPFKEIERCIRCWDVLGPVNASMNLMGNVAAFLPLGFMLPVLADSGRKWYVILFSSLLCSLAIESLQLVTRRGTFDVDDLMLNTLGGILGYLCFLAADGVFRKLRR